MIATFVDLDNSDRLYLNVCTVDSIRLLVSTAKLVLFKVLPVLGVRYLEFRRSSLYCLNASIDEINIRLGMVDDLVHQWKFDVACRLAN